MSDPGASSHGPPEEGAGAEITVAMLAADPQLGIPLQRVAGASGLTRPIRHPRVQKSGLALAGHFLGVVPTRVQIFGETELSYLESLTPDLQSITARGFFALGLSCVIVANGHEPSRPLVAAAEASGTPLLVTTASTSLTINAIHAVLDERLAPQTRLHGVLVDVFGVGLLLLGKSGIGKSECALELVLRGHRLVADDIVQCDWRPPGMIFGRAADLLRHHIEVRGLGVLNVEALFGVTSVRARKRIDVVVRLVEWDDRAEYDRLGLDDTYIEILNARIRELTVPVRPGRDMGSILEIAARNELLRRAGTHSPREFMSRLEEQLVGPTDAMPESGFAGAAQHGALPAVPPRRPTLEPPRPPVRSEGREWSRGPSTRSSFPPERGTNLNESSAWIPAVRPKGEEE